MNEHFWEMAQTAARVAGPPIKPEWIYSQWYHETGGFTSLDSEYHNYGGLCQKRPNSTPQPDGDEYYIQFTDDDAYSNYFGHYIDLYVDNGILNSQTVDDYITALHDGGYFTDSLEAYLADVKGIMADNFPGVA
ncbi:MAG: hypothetical protein P4N59_07490 [Negativicutes bacterium]|nr:hypothetical protein [Negativicutes bacterium]